MVWLDGSLFMKPLWGGADSSASDFEASNSVLPDVRPPIPRLTSHQLSSRSYFSFSLQVGDFERLLDCLLKFLARRLRR
jgi:hypothetical protein